MSEQEHIDFDKHLRKLLREAYGTDSLDTTSDYDASFAAEGARKVAFIKDDLKNLFEQKKLAAEDIVLLSVGGADGSDVVEILKRTKITHGILLEYSREQAQKARDASNRLRRIGKHLIVFQGDATRNRSEVILELEKLKIKNGKTCLACICLGVLHELEKRSPGFTLTSFIPTLGKSFDNFLFYASEPTVPNNWPEDIQLRFGNASATTLKDFSDYIRSRLWIDEKDIPKDPVEEGDFVRLRRDLAMEVLFKSVRRHSPERHRYEMGERMTSFLIEKFKLCWLRMKKSRLDDIETISMATQGFLHDYRKANLTVQNDSVGLEPPHSHIRIIARRLISGSAAPSSSPSPSNVPPLSTHGTEIVSENPENVAEINSQRMIVIAKLDEFNISLSGKTLSFIKRAREGNAKSKDANEIVAGALEMLEFIEFEIIPKFEALPADRELKILSATCEKIRNWNRDFVTGFVKGEPNLIRYNEPREIIADTKAALLRRINPGPDRSTSHEE